MVGVDRHVRIGQEHLQAALPFQCVLDGFAQWAARFHVLAVDLVIAPLPEGPDARFAVLGAGLLLVGPFPSLFADPGFDLVDPGNPQQGFLCGVIAVTGLPEMAPRVGPTFRVGHPWPFLGIAGIRGIAIGQQHALEVLAQDLVDMRLGPRWGEGEADLVVVAVQWPEPRLLHLTLTFAAGLDRCLVHGQHVAFQHVIELGKMDRREQRRRTGDLLGQRGPTERDACLQQALMLAVERQVVAELVDQHPGDEADIGQRTVEQCGRRRHGLGNGVRSDLDHRATVPQHLVAGPALGQTEGAARGDHLDVVQRHAVGRPAALPGGRRKHQCRAWQCHCR